ncbi:MAG: aminoglycoside phosphotransferase family protein [Gaiellaceae bacterium]
MSSKRWAELKLGEALGEGLVACLRPDGTEAVLRLPPSVARGRQEIAALRAWDGRFAPELLEVDDDGVGFLLERIRPGRPALDVGAAEVAELLAGLHVLPPDGLPSLARAVRARLNRAAGSVTPQRLAWARTALERLSVDAPSPVLLHGRFDEHALVRCDRRGLCALAPAPCAGDPAYDAACRIHAGGRSGRRARFDALADATGLDRARLRDWCGVVAVHG